MELNQDDIELLDRYFRNELTSEELTVLQSKMKSAEFSTAAKFHFESLSVVQSAGREELLLSLSAIQKNIEQQNGFEKYKASKSKKGGSNGGGFMVVVVAGIVAVAVYLFSTGKLDEEHIKSTFPQTEKVDTVYHYNVIRDTIYLNTNDTAKSKIIRKAKPDTVFIRQKSTPSVNGQNGNRE